VVAEVLMRIQAIKFMQNVRSVNRRKNEETKPINLRFKREYSCH